MIPRILIATFVSIVLVVIGIVIAGVQLISGVGLDWWTYGFIIGGFLAYVIINIIANTLNKRNNVKRRF